MNLNYPKQFYISKQIHLVISVWDEKKYYHEDVPYSDL